MAGIPDMFARFLGRTIRDQTVSVPDRTLRLTKDGTFQISVFEDLHFAEDSNKDVHTNKVMDYVLDKEKPQLVVINGDLISGEATKASNSSKYLDQVVSPLVNGGYLWASTYGNHDSELNLDPRKDIYDKEKLYKNSLTQSLVSDSAAGVTNYYLPVFSQGGSEGDTPVLLLWFFDSKGGHEPTNRVSKRASIQRGDWVDDSVVDWFTQTKSDLKDKYGKVIPSLAFYHIPADAMRAYQDNGVDSHKSPGLNGETVVQQGSGASPYTGQDVPFMQALLNTSGLMATFSGHDHDNDWCFKWDGKTIAQDLSGNGINMCYGRHTGYGGYGNAARGGRQILLNKDSIADEVETWIRLEDGTISAHVTLNSTYGQDQYAPVTRQVTARMAGGSVSLHNSSSLLYMMYLWVAILVLRQWKGH
ncbi:uncharacterized protein N7503_000865 [Penicillium pulvis]|uniref:uncharacterized protein n=1 Tax=Penicillium pulvis TaxID=1562058 RepID=UPI0025478F89|nr:uncharacterized protein N7503_000865 [Penicillium pulvis]KAJ5814115.1 hypothetical protein N7503_000865 [Penicillium pulvis]